MSTYFAPDKDAKTIEIPVRVQKGNKIEFFYEGELPNIQEGVLCRLIVPAYGIKENSQQLQLSADKTISFIPEGSRILVAISIEDQTAIEKSLMEKLIVQRDRTKQCLDRYRPGIFGDSGPVEIILQEELKLTLRGTKRAKLEPCRCTIPILGDKQAISLNQAYSLISQEFEKHRASHTGSAFRSMYKMNEKGNDCISLDTLRKLKEAEDEQERFQNGLV